MTIFSVENGFCEETGLGYNKKGLNRLNARYNKFIVPYRKQLKGKRILDLASHDGRWSYACVLNGAQEVVGIEARPELIEKSKFLFDEAVRSKVNFIQGDVFEVLPKLHAEGEAFDAVLCLGLFYHIMDHYRLLREILAFSPQFVIVDTGLVDSEESLISVQTESSQHFLNAISDFPGQGKTAVGVVSRGALAVMVNVLGYELEYVEWRKEDYKDRSQLHDYLGRNYLGRKRFTILLTPSAV